MRKIDTDYLIWAALALPLGLVFYRIYGPFPSVSYERLSWRTAEVSTYLLIISLMATPLSMLTRGRFGTRWLVRKRRYIGVAALGYGIVHTVFYFMHTGLAKAWGEVLELNVWTGYVVLAILIPLGWTSRDSEIRRLGLGWKRLQRWVYPAAALTVLHWACQFDWQGWQEPVMYFAPLAALTLYRIHYNWSLSRRRRAAS